MDTTHTTGTENLAADVLSKVKDIVDLQSAVIRELLAALVEVSNKERAGD